MFSIILGSCDEVAKLSKDEEGIVDFDTKGVDEKHPLYGLAPGEAKLIFKKEKFMIEMSTMGMFNMKVIGDNKSKTLAQTVKFMNIKQACIETEKDLIEENADYKLQIEELNETKEIAGLKCHKLKVTKLSEPGVTFDAWYTKALGMENCNSLTPYAQVKGVLMDYRIKKLGMEMHFLAKSYQHHEINDHEFEIPAAFRIVSKEEMAKFFKDLEQP